MGRNKKVECKICLKTMRSNNLERHMKKHEKKTNGIYEFETPSRDALGEMKHVDKDENSMIGVFAEMKHIDDAGTNRRVTSSEKCTNIDLEKLRSECIVEVKEFERKIELGRNINKIINEEGFNINALSGDKKEALKTYQLYGKNMDMEDIKWRGWQKELREYLDKPCNRKIIWVVGVVGNEGKSFFQRNICEEFGYSRVCKIALGENARNTFHIVGKEYSTNTDIFLFNVPRAQYLHTEQYEILEKIKDGWATSPKYNGRNLNFKTPNVLIVFANRKPNIEKLSKDRWIILKISKDLSKLTEITCESSMVKNKKKKIENESDESNFSDSDHGYDADCF